MKIVKLTSLLKLVERVFRDIYVEPTHTITEYSSLCLAYTFAPCPLSDDEIIEKFNDRIQDFLSVEDEITIKKNPADNLFVINYNFSVID